MPISRSIPLLSSLIACLLMTGCDQVGERVQIKDTREISKHATRPPAGVASVDRFPQMDREAPEMRQPEPPSPEELFDWITPA